MKISVIIPAYNNSAITLRSLETWAKQTYSRFEVIIVDNNSTDDTELKVKELINRYPQFIYIKETICGATNARHAGAKLAKGDILLFADNDGLYNKECLNAVLNVFENYPDVAAVTGKIELQWDQTPPAWIEPYEFMLGKLDYGKEIITGNNLFLNGGLFAIRKTIFEEMGGFNPDLVGEHLVGDGDTGLVLKLHDNNKLIGYTPYAIMKHMQFVNRHGTVKDLGRRFFNTGISNTYGFFRKQYFHFNRIVLNYIIVTFIFYCKKGIEYLFTGEKKKFFSYMERKGQLAFFINLRKQSVRNEVFKMNSYKTDKT